MLDERATRDASRRPLDVVAAVVGATVFLATAAVASSGRVGDVERQAFEAINGLPSWLEPTATVVQFAGTLVVGPIVVVLAIAVRRSRLAIAAALVTVAKLVGERLIWEVIVRERPGTTEPAAIVRGSVPTSGPSFVSGHVVLTTGLAWVLTPYLPGRWKVVPWVVVALVAFSRIYLGAHNPLDVVGGFGLGSAIGGAASSIVGLSARREG